MLNYSSEKKVGQKPGQKVGQKVGQKGVSRKTQLHPLLSCT